MATDKPRISVMLEPKTYELLRELAQLQGESMSSIVAGVLDASVPVLTNLRAAARRYERLSASAKAEMTAQWSSAEGKLLPHVQEIEREWLGLVGEDAVPDPRLVTRGSSTPTPLHAHSGKGVRK